jgi:hypothetical protein
MQGNLISYRQAAGFFRFPTAVGSGTRSPLRESLSPRKEPSGVDEVVGPDAYMVAVMLSIAAAILSGCL